MSKRRTERARALIRAAERLPKLKRAYVLSVAEGQVLRHREPESGALWRMREDLHLGERVTVFVSDAWNKSPQPRQGSVCYIHPEKRYYTVEFRPGNRSSFPWGFAE